MSKLAGKVALITGSTSGIGLGIAKVLAAHGADLILNGLESSGAAQAILEDVRRSHANPKASKSVIWLSTCSIAR